MLEELFHDAPFPSTCDSSALLKSFLLQWAMSDPARMHFQMSIHTESGMTVMRNLRVVANETYPLSPKRWDRRDRQTYYDRSSLKTVEYQLQATAQLLTAAFVQVQLGIFYVSIITGGFLQSNTNIYWYIIPFTHDSIQSQCCSNDNGCKVEWHWLPKIKNVQSNWISVKII